MEKQYQLSENAQRVINRARYLLNPPHDSGNPPPDVLHDLDHHTETVANCIYISKREGILGFIDINALQIAVHWHDIYRDDVKRNDEELTITMKQVGLPQTYINKVLKIKNSHSFGCAPDTLEGQILFDGDKIEYVSKKRVQKALYSYLCREISEESFQENKLQFMKRIPVVRSQLHFDTAVEMFDIKRNELREFAQNDPLLNDIIAFL